MDELHLSMVEWQEFSSASVEVGSPPPAQEDLVDPVTSPQHQRRSAASNASNTSGTDTPTDNVSLPSSMRTQAGLNLGGICCRLHPGQTRCCRCHGPMAPHRTRSPLPTSHRKIWTHREGTSIWVPCKPSICTKRHSRETMCLSRICLSQMA